MSFASDHQTELRTAILTNISQVEGISDLEGATAELRPG